jgi:hypothetical protein
MILLPSHKVERDKTVVTNGGQLGEILGGLITHVLFSKQLMSKGSNKSTFRQRILINDKGFFDIVTEFLQ